MKAAVLEKFGEPLAIKAVPDPAIGAGEADQCVKGQQHTFERLERHCRQGSGD